jgi:hypothetical protein
MRKRGASSGRSRQRLLGHATRVCGWWRSLRPGGESGFSRPRATWRLRFCDRMSLLAFAFAVCSGRGVAEGRRGGRGRWGSGLAAGGESADARRRSPSGFIFGFARVNARMGSTVVSELALRPGFSPQARMPPTARFASRGARRGLLVLTAGPVVSLHGRYPTGPVASSQSRRNARGFSPSSLRAVPTEGWEGVKT